MEKYPDERRAYESVDNRNHHHSKIDWNKNSGTKGLIYNSAEYS